MKRLLLVLAAVTIVGGVAMAAEKPMAPEVRSTLEQAVTNERDAAERYEAFAVKADAEGYHGAAALFRAQAAAEKIHARRFAQALKTAGLAVPEPAAKNPEVGSTEENLSRASSAEAGERDGFYHDAVAACRAAKNEKIAKLFDETRDAEVEHANLDAAAMRNLDQMKSSRTYLVCGHCGYTTDIRLPMCPSCRTRGQLDPVD